MLVGVVTVVVAAVLEAVASAEVSTTVTAGGAGGGGGGGGAFSLGTVRCRPFRRWPGFEVGEGEDRRGGSGGLGTMRLEGGGDDDSTGDASSSSSVSFDSEPQFPLISSIIA